MADLASAGEKSFKRASTKHDPDHAPKKKLRLLEEKAAMGAAEEACLTVRAACEFEAGPGNGYGNIVKQGRTLIDSSMDNCVFRIDGATDLACERKFSASAEISINGDDPLATALCDCAHPINGDDPIPTVPSDCGHPVNGDDSIPAHLQNASIEDPTITGNSIHRKDLTSAYIRKASKEAHVGPRCFTSSLDMLNFFNQLLHGWPLNLDVNKYEHMMLEDLLMKGHPDYQEKMGAGIRAFQVRVKKEFDSRCFYVMRKDGSMADFSYRKCVDKILSLPKNAKPKCLRGQNRKGPETGDNARVAGCKNLHRNKGREGKHGGDGQGGNGIGRGDHGSKSGSIRKRF